MSEQSDFNLPEEIEAAVKAVFSHPKPNPTFVDRLGHQLSDQVEQFTTRQRKVLLPVSPLAWGAIGIIFLLLLIWGIKTLVPRVAPSISGQSTPSPSIAPTMEATPAKGAEGVINLPTLAGMPVPWPKEAITSKNASQITLLARWGEETISAVTLAPDGKSFAVASSNKITIYDSASFQRILTIANDSNAYHLEYSPDGTKLASSAGSVKIWDVASGSALQTLETPEDYISEMAFSPEGVILATGTYDKEGPITLWDANTGQQLRTLCVSAGIFAFSPDWSIIAAVSEHRTIKLWAASSGEELHTLDGRSTVYGMAFSPDGSKLASWSADLTIKLWDVATGNEMRTLSIQANNVAFLPDGTTLIYSPANGPITLLDITSGQVLRTFGDETPRSNILLSSDGKWVFYYEVQGNEITLWDITSGKVLRKLAWQSYDVAGVGISPDGKIIAVGLASGPIKLLDANSGQELRTLMGHTQGANSLAFSPDGAKLASGSPDTTTRLWDVVSGEELSVMDGVKSGGWLGGATSVDFSPDGKLLAFAGLFGQVKVWDIANHVQLHTLGGQAGGAIPDEVTGVAFSPDGTILVSGYISGSIILWDPLSGQELRTLRKQSYSSNGWIRGISGLEFSPDGKTLASGCVDNNITLWDAANWSELRTYSLSGGLSNLFFSPDGGVLAVGIGGVAFTVLDASSGKVLNTMEGFQGNLAFSPDGKVIISGSWDGTIRLWGVAPLNTAQSEAISPSTEVRVISITTPAPEVPPEDIGIERIPLPVLLTGENLQPGNWSPDGKYFYYTNQGLIGEPGPDQAIKSLSFLDTHTGETCPSIQETVSFTQTEFSYGPEGIDLSERTLWTGDNYLFYISPGGDLLALTPCSGSNDNWSVSLPDSISSFSQDDSKGGLQIVLKGEQAYWLLSPSTRQSLKLDLPDSEEGKEVSFAWSDWEPKLISSRIEDRQGERWIILESIDTATGSASLITEILASPELGNGYPMSAGIERISKDQISITDSMTGSKLYNISSKTIQLVNPLSDLFGIESPDMQGINAWGSVGDHEILDTGGNAGGQYYIYHPESGRVDKYSLDTPLLVVFPNGEGGIVQSSEQNPPSNNTYKVILVDSGLEPYDLVAKGYTAGQDTWGFATTLPDAQRVLFSSKEGISLVDLKSGEILNYWVFENQEQYVDLGTWLSPDGKTVVGFASAKWYTNQAMYWLRLEP